MGKSVDFERIASFGEQFGEHFFGDLAAHRQKANKQ